MPLKFGTKKVKGVAKRYVKWGDSGKEYYYVPENERSRNLAIAKSMKQMRAIKFSQSNR